MPRIRNGNRIDTMPMMARGSCARRTGALCFRCSIPRTAPVSHITPCMMMRETRVAAGRMSGGAAAEHTLKGLSPLASAAVCQNLQSTCLISSCVVPLSSSSSVWRAWAGLRGVIGSNERLTLQALPPWRCPHPSFRCRNLQEKALDSQMTDS